MARRRASGEGGLHYWEEKGLWVGRITLPNGKRMTKYSKRQQVVKDWLLSERGKIKQGTYVTDDCMTVETFVHRYFEDRQRSVRVTTFDFYRGWITRHIIPELGNVRLTQLRPDHINQFLTKMEAA